MYITNENEQCVYGPCGFRSTRPLGIGGTMIKSLYAITTAVLLLLLPVVSAAELSNDELLAIGKFLVMDYKTAKDAAMKRPVSDAFFVKEQPDSVVITNDLIRSIPSLSKRIRDKLLPGRYKGIIIINEIRDIGCVVRNASIGEQKQIYWSDELQSLHKLAKRPELGNSGVMVLMDYTNTEALEDLFKNVKRGSLPTTWRPKTEEIHWYLLTLDLFYTILINRP